MNSGMVIKIGKHEKMRYCISARVLPSLRKINPFRSEWAKEQYRKVNRAGDQK